MIYNKLINEPGRLTPLPTITLFYSRDDPDPSKTMTPVPSAERDDQVEAIGDMA